MLFASLPNMKFNVLARATTLLAAAACSAALIASAPSQAISFADSTTVTESKAPWIVSLWATDALADRQAEGYFCTGALIDKLTVVTAAHCVEGAAAQNFVVIQGQSSATDTGEVLQVRSIRRHGAYRASNYRNDIALIELYTPTSINKFLKLPSAAVAKKGLANKPALFGWGRTETGEKSTTLRSGIQKDLTAAARRLFKDFNPKTQIGVGRLNGKGKFVGACRGDSGGPLVGTFKGKQYLLGVVSYGAAESCQVKVARVFTRVSAYSSWITRARADLAALRIADQVDISGVNFKGSLPTTTTEVFTGVLERFTTAGFVTEKFTDARLDIASLNVRTRNLAGDSNQIVGFDIVTRELWPEALCESPTSFEDVSVRLQLKSANSRAVGLQFSGAVLLGPCRSDSFPPMLVTSTEGAVPEGCEAFVGVVKEPLLGTVPVVRVAMNAACLTSPAETYARVTISSFTETDLEPGLDQWAGPFILTPVALQS